jgi:hypothetical protein
MRVVCRTARAAFLVGLLVAASGCGGSGSADVVRASQTQTADQPTPVASCSSAFKLSLVSDRNGQASPVAAAQWCVVHGGIAGLPQSGWREVDTSDASASSLVSATLASGSSLLHTVQGPDKTWQVDSGQPCG